MGKNKGKSDGAGCVEPAAGPVESAAASTVPGGNGHQPRQITLARVGGKAPDFEAAAFFNGTFKNIRLSDYKGKWVVLCFYPGDFTFV